MRFQPARKAIILVFLSGLAAQIGLALTSYCLKQIFVDELTTIIVNLLQVYSVHLAVVLSTAFFSDTSRNAKLNGTVFIASISLIVLWNLLLITRLVLFILPQKDNIDLLINFQKDIAANSNFLIAGLIAYFFSVKGKSS
jgi:hypothetical protein